jgi:hypothetical protein
MTSMPSMSGRADVEDDQVGWPSGQGERGPPGGGGLDVVPAGAQVDRECPQEVRLVLDDEHACHGASGSVTVIVRPPPGVSAGVRVPAHCLGEAAGDGKTESDTCSVCGPVAKPLKGLEDPRPFILRNTGSSVRYM